MKLLVFITIAFAISCQSRKESNIVSLIIDYKTPHSESFLSYEVLDKLKSEGSKAVKPIIYNITTTKVPHGDPLHTNTSRYPLPSWHLFETLCEILKEEDYQVLYKHYVTGTLKDWYSKNHMAP